MLRNVLFTRGIPVPYPWSYSANISHQQSQIEYWTDRSSFHLPWSHRTWSSIWTLRPAIAVGSNISIFYFQRSTAAGLRAEARGRPWHGSVLAGRAASIAGWRKKAGAYMHPLNDRTDLTAYPYCPWCECTTFRLLYFLWSIAGPCGRAV